MNFESKHFSFSFVV